MSVGLNQILVASAGLLGIGAFALIARRHLLVTLFGTQFMLLAGALAFVAFGHFGIGIRDQNAAPVMALFAGGVMLAELTLMIAMAAVLYGERRTFLDDGERR